MLKKILFGLAAIIAVFLAIVALQPAEFRVERSTVINAPVAVVFANVNDLRKWEAWSPWAKMDPGMKQTYEGAAAGVGAVTNWSGNDEVGEGRMTIVESRRNELIQIKLEFLKPFAATNITLFTFKPESDWTTTVTWAMTGENNFFFKALCLFMDMDKMVGGDFEKGLAALKSLAETPKS
jgi:hypothetical protein